MENNGSGYSPDQALADAREAKVDAARILVQPARFHVARGVLAAVALAIFATESLGWMLALMAVAIIGMIVVDRSAANATGAEPGPDDARVFWPANRRAVLVAAVVGIVVMGLMRAMEWPSLWCLGPAGAYGVVWALMGVRGDQARVRAAQASH